MPLPEKIKNKPTLNAGLDFYWKAFADLSTDRDMGMGEGLIPWTSVHFWGLRHQVTGDDFERLWLIIRGTDSVYIEKRNLRSKTKMGKTKSFSKAKSLGSK